MTCPICKRKKITPAHILGHSKSPAKTSAARMNGRLGGRPRKIKKTERLEMTQLESIEKSAQTAAMLRDEIHQARKIACEQNPLLALMLEDHHKSAIDLQTKLERLMVALISE